jgi:hypothetical protein
MSAALVAVAAGVLGLRHGLRVAMAAGVLGLRLGFRFAMTAGVLRLRTARVGAGTCVAVTMVFLVHQGRDLCCRFCLAIA